ncbi:MAG TPA: UDP-N-acetylmuramate--L-alanine ligase [candidate division WOR-3 bacterium]|uniref:UDP-N-acetylmuramate--L-alanine ligase n=1 Tax=candidate division WOR-3 bacterium TaxID=2052148 RepID=A0A7V0T475_UNCW3|nr:UDP-N-acetylmuramate--L-alanine ligase [candidate division WOR-3 bacterium]
MLGRLRRVHFIGVGGVGMSGIALLLQNLGFEVSGSDLAESEMTRRLAEAGVRVSIGHRAEHCLGAEVVVFSTAIGSDNPEMVAAREQGVPVIRRAEMLAELMRLKFSVAVSGSHGKTTVTSLVGHVLERAGLDPTTVVGGRVLGAGAGARLGQSEYLVAEADESDRSFLVLYPSIAVVTNIEAEHLDFYKNLADIRRTFVSFVNRVPFYGSVILCTDSPAVRAIRSRVKRRVVSYGLETPADLTVRDVQEYAFSSAFTLLVRGRARGRFSVPMPGRHNIQNALAAVAVALELGVEPRVVEQALLTFAGVHRRLERKGEKGGIEVFDDYGHHPTEVRVTVEALRHAFPDRRLVVVFEPHRYSRTRHLGSEFGVAFDAADVVFVTRVYAASEEPLPDADEKVIVEAVRRDGREGIELHHLSVIEKLAVDVARAARPGDVILTLGAGSIWQTGEQILNAL